MSVIDLFQVPFRAAHTLSKFVAAAAGNGDGAYLATLADSGAIGIVQRDVASGQSAPVMLHGISRALAGLAVTAGQRVTATTSGYIVPVTSGAAAATHILGTALTGAASGMIFHCHIDRRFNGQSGAAL